MEVYLKRPWTCKLCGSSGLFSLAEKSEHLGKCQDVEEEEDNKADEKELKEDITSGVAKRLIPTKEYSCDKCGGVFQFTNVEILRHMREHDVIS